MNNIVSMDIGDSSGVVLSETAVVETWRKHWSVDEVYKLADDITAKKKEKSNWIEVGDILLTLLKEPGYVNTMLSHYMIMIGKRTK